jgi:hypothetical protein
MCKICDEHFKNQMQEQKITIPIAQGARMTDRLLEVLKNPPRHKSCSSCHYAVNGGNCFKSREKCDEIDYPEWRKQVIAAVMVDEGKFKETYDEYWVKSEDSSIKTLPDLPTFLIANREGRTK